jgi:hypothetical protein
VPTKYQLVINVQTAKTLGLEVPLHSTPKIPRFRRPE